MNDFDKLVGAFQKEDFSVTGLVKNQSKCKNNEFSITMCLSVKEEEISMNFMVVQTEFW